MGVLYGPSRPKACITMCHFGLIFLFISGLFPSGIFAGTLKANGDTCDLYLDLEKQLKCATAGHEYLTVFGYKYCTRFQNQKQKGSKKFQTWAHDTSQCLQEMLVDNSKRIGEKCARLEEFAFDTHSTCYKETGFCRLSEPDQKIFRDVLFTLEGAYDFFKELRRSLIQACNVGMSCFGTLKETPAETAALQRLQQGISRLSPVAQEAATEIVLGSPKEDEKRIEKYYLSVLPKLLFMGDFDLMGEAAKVYSTNLSMIGQAQVAHPSERTYDAEMLFSEPASYRANTKVKKALSRARTNFSSVLTDKQVLDALGVARGLNGN